MTDTSNELTQPHAPVDPGQTVRHVPIALSDTQPVKRPVRTSRRRRSGCLRTTTVLFILSFISTLFLVFAYWVFPPPRLNILVLGLDARSGEGSVTRTDTNILITMNPDEMYMGMLSFPRDLYVNVPEHGMQRLNTANVLGELQYTGGGLDLAARTIETNFNVPVHRTVRLDFQAFIAIIDAAGGVEIDVPEYFIDYEYPTSDYQTQVVEFQPGRQTMTGERALQYARVRHGSSDFARASRQQQVLEALVKKLLNPANWHRLPGVYAAFQQHVDTDLTLLDLVQVAPVMLWSSFTEIDHQVLDQEMVSYVSTEGGASVLAPRWERVTPLLDEMFRD